MDDREFSKQLLKYLSDVHSIEEQALTQLRVAPRMVGDETLADVYRRHLAETEEQERRVRAAIEARGADPSIVKDVAGKAGGLAMLTFARSQPDTPGKLTAHAYSYEHMEIAAYELLRRIARHGGDEEAAAMAREICAEETEMAARLEACFEIAVDASLRAVSDRKLDTHLNHYIADAHALEQQALQVLQASPKLLSDAQLAAPFEDHLEETREHERRIRERLEARGASPSRVKDAALRVGGLNIGGFFAVQPDTPIKLAGFAFAFEHIEAAGYELLKRVAQRAGDEETAVVAGEILAQERAQGDRVRESFDRAVAVGLQVQGVHA
jgi:ferritin-like metal-binding protein YciE